MWCVAYGVEIWGIFLPLIFYRKSILGIVKVQKLPICQICMHWILSLMNFCNSMEAEKRQNQNSEPKNLQVVLLMNF